MVRIYTFTNAADTNYHNVWTAIKAITGVYPADSNDTLISNTYILPDRVCFFSITASGTSNLSDFNNANVVGQALAANTPFIIQTARDIISLPDLFVKGSAVTFTIVTVSAG